MASAGFSAVIWPTNFSLALQPLSGSYTFQYRAMSSTLTRTGISQPGASHGETSLQAPPSATCLIHSPRTFAYTSTIVP